MNDKITNKEQAIIDALNLVKTDYIKCKQSLQFSIRKDIVAAELKSLLAENSDFFSLKAALEDYTNNLLKIEGGN